MSDFRLEVFYTVAKRLSFTKAAAELFVTQPAITKHIRELEDQYKNKLFERKGNQIELTAAGSLLFKYADDLFAIYRNIEFEMNALIDVQQGLLRVGASTTIAQYVIAPDLAGFRKKFADIRVSLINGNTDQIERALINKEIDLGIIEGRHKNPEISYTEFLKDEIVLICSKDHPLAKRTSINPEELLDNRFVLREQGSGTLEVIGHKLKPFNIKPADLAVEIYLGSTESIKLYLLHSPCLAFISIHSVSKEVKSGELRVIDVKNLTIDRHFYFIHLQGKADGMAELFMRFAAHAHNLR